MSPWTAGSAKPEQAPLKVAWIYPGPHNDGGWAQAHDDGRLLVEKMLGDKVETTYKENVFSNAQVPQIVAGLARDGYTMIFGCSFGQLENGVNGQLYAKYPDIKFEQATGLNRFEEEGVASELPLVADEGRLADGASAGVATGSLNSRRTRATTSSVVSCVEPPAPYVQVMKLGRNPTSRVTC